MSPNLRLALILAVPLALVGCGDGDKKGKDQRTAAGEILPGSISDAMLPYDTVRSQPPLAPQETGKAGIKGGTRAEATPGESAAADPSAETSPAPAETPAASPSPAE
jgi:hypothetical protein